MTGLEGIERNTSTLFEACIRNYSKKALDLLREAGIE
jgi:hypothetical protein